MSAADTKPLNWTPEPGIGYQVARRPDGGLQVTFFDASPATVAHWRAFALDHLLDSDRLTRNLYDLRKLASVPPEAMQFALEVNNDPSVRNIRLAVVAEQPEIVAAVQQIAALSGASGVELAVFPDLAGAEAWLSRPLTQLL